MGCFLHHDLEVWKDGIHHIWIWLFSTQANQIYIYYAHRGNIYKRKQVQGLFIKVALFTKNMTYFAIPAHSCRATIKTELLNKLLTLWATNNNRPRLMPS